MTINISNFDCQQLLKEASSLLNTFEFFPGDNGFSGLDEFTSLLTDNDARLLVDLLKLAVADRIEDDQAKDILSSVLISNCFKPTKLQNYYMYCVFCSDGKLKSINRSYVARALCNGIGRYK